VIRLRRQTDIARRAVEVRRDDVPAYASVGEVVERGHATRERIRVFVRERTRHAEAEMLRDVCHRGDKQDGVVHRHLRGLANRSLAAALIDVVDAQHVGNEKAIEQAAFEQLRKLCPVAEFAVAPRSVARMRPEARRLMPDAVHVEGVKANLSGHV
jgi:hypothetical protein